jgi:hypothetical protein
MPKYPHLSRSDVKATVLVSLLLVAPGAWAYLDPSTGSMILSAVIGMFATAALAIKTYWYKLKGLFRRGRPTAHGTPDSRESGDRQQQPVSGSGPGAD